MRLCRALTSSKFNKIYWSSLKERDKKEIRLEGVVEGEGEGEGIERIGLDQNLCAALG